MRRVLAVVGHLVACSIPGTSFSRNWKFGPIDPLLQFPLLAASLEPRGAPNLRK